MKMIKKTVKLLLNRVGYDISRVNRAEQDQMNGGPDFKNLCRKYTDELMARGAVKAHYGCGNRMFGAGWVNVGLGIARTDITEFYLTANLAMRHPFPSNHFLFSFAEDFLEHLTQDESLVFLSEAFRCLRKGGVLRLSFPGLRGVLRDHYFSSDYEGASFGQAKAYLKWDHKHFYCEESLEVVARHIGFSKIEFVEYGESKHKELVGLDHRIEQKGLNIYAELTK